MGNQKQTGDKKIHKMWKIGHSKFSFKNDIDLKLYVDNYYDLHSHNNHHDLQKCRPTMIITVILV